MSLNIRYPNITGKNEAEQLIQVKSYLHQLVEQLNWALGAIETGKTQEASGSLQTAGGGSGAENAASFNEIKALVIKSAETVSAYYEKVSRKLEREYVAQSAFGEYKESAAQDIQENADAIGQLFQNVQQILTDIEGLENTFVQVNASIKSGLLYYDSNGAPVYGLEIGQKTKLDGVEVFNKFARFTAARLSFYDQNDNEVAYISDRKLYITHVEVRGSFTMGGFVKTVLPDGSTVKKWVRQGG